MIKKVLLILAFGFVASNAEVVNSVIAVVENEPITNYELAQVKKSAKSRRCRSVRNFNKFESQNSRNQKTRHYGKFL